MTRVAGKVSNKKNSGVKDFFKGFWNGFSGVFKFIGKNVLPISQIVKAV